MVTLRTRTNEQSITWLCTILARCEVPGSLTSVQLTAFRSTVVRRGLCVLCAAAITLNHARRWYKLQARSHLVAGLARLAGRSAVPLRPLHVHWVLIALPGLSPGRAAATRKAQSQDRAEALSLDKCGNHLRVAVDGSSQCPTLQVLCIVASGVDGRAK